ncbi:hypothetical protein LCGC14_1452050 [marine sediment metagenome]|uniref:DUF7680 domain-containing protein n=1 Tax=marine sediment metagenome TaxID=412755 RepID=A0A0F9MJC6_9ZZZZ
MVIRKNRNNERIIQLFMETFKQLKFYKDRNSPLFQSIENNIIPEPKKCLLFNKISSIKGWRLTLIEHYIKGLANRKKIFENNLVQENLLKQKINIIDTLRRANDLELLVEEEFGVRLALLFESIRNINVMTRIDKILNYVRTISKEEAYYWFSKCFFRKFQKSGLRAFKILALNQI